MWLSIGGIAALVIVAFVAGAIYEAIASTGDAARYPAAGRLIDVGGYRLHLNCLGEGSPTVVMDAGLGGSSLDWSLVQTQVATITRVCAYDRAGMGWSEVGPAPRSPTHIAEELHALLSNASVAGPYVLVAHSLAGKNIRMFALAHPDEVAGMVLVDARSELVDSRTSPNDADAFSGAIKAQGVIYTIARRLGIARLLGRAALDLPLVPAELATEMVLLQTQPNAIEETTQEGLARAADDSTLAASTLGSLPLVVIAAQGSMSDTPNWPDAQSGLVALSTASRFVLAENSGHYVQLERPELVIDAIESVVAAVRAAP